MEKNTLNNNKENFTISNTTKEMLAQLQISVAYFCSIGLYFLV